ncbi:DUF3419 family protein [Tenacibaculum jejuense]|uniref:S-adenosylmethionine:diacylglycerol 3-amino-3-carboxypropyl transferase n=1 Tax=Tenacibaculum jejuense TaxID=584609 RepID=A0A238UCL9_9FLAO|nr:BtaA family protein [Tenacibaculum jejuense]SNR16842.1 conserved protein of unknown function [Tenacibaculum jejuense]
MSRLQNWFFHQIHGKKLIYNACWEDPRCDRKLLQLNKNSKLVMITSAGDNLLDYLLDEPTEIHSVDMNFRQNALLELKRTMFQYGDYEALFQFFGEGNFKEAKSYYRKYLRENLPDYAKEYWDEHIHYFQGKGKRNSFYYRGASGALAYLCRKYLYTSKKIRQNLENFMTSNTLKQQESYYTILEEKIFNPFISLLLNNHLTMYLAGVPRAQQALIQESYSGGNVAYIKESFRNVFTQLDIGDNYFYQVYLKGFYTQECCPEYLKQDNFLKLKDQQNNAYSYTTTLSGFLKENPAEYSHYVLLDHQDWLAANNVPALEEEWSLILKNSKPGTRILMRSAAKEIDFFPDFVKDRVDFDKELSDQLHKEDRVGTYASVYLGIVK